MQTKMKEMRARTSMTQEELARKTGVRRETIVFLEQGKYNPSLRLAHSIAKQFGIPIEEVFVFDDDEPEHERHEILID